jgi:iron complex outermembrane recepter protein
MLFPIGIPYWLSDQYRLRFKILHMMYTHLKSLYSLWIACLLFIPVYGRASSGEPLQGSLTGKISDKKTGEPLPGVIIYFPDLKTGTISDKDGNYKIEHLPLSRVNIQLSFISYRTLIESVDLATVKVRDFVMEYAATELNEVVITGLSKATEQKRNPAPVSIMPRLELLQNASTNIIDAIATQPGISQITTGTGISKPVIRGLGYNRVVVVNDGIRQEGQQWGDEHGIEIDAFSVNRVEILKGPASLAYGSDAMAGVINMISAPSLPQGKITGNLLLNYQTNNGMAGISGDLAGNQKGLVWDLRYSNKIAHAYQNRYDGFVFNSGFRENAVSLMTGLIKSWGYSNLYLSAYNLTPGIIEGDRDSTTGKFVKPVALNDSTSGSVIVPDHALTTYTPGTPYQQIHHYKAVLNNSFILGNSNLKTVFGFQQNQRQEYADILKPNQYGLYFLMNTFNFDLRCLLPEKNNYFLSVGINGMQQDSKNKGGEFLIPAYGLFDMGAFALVRKSSGKFDLSGGLRYDFRIEHGHELYTNAGGEKLPGPGQGSILRFPAFNRTFTGISGSIGATWQISKAFYTKLNLSRGVRTPNIAELSSNGVHEGTSRYETGNPALKAESSLQTDYTIGLSMEHVSAELNVFSNTIDHYIFSRKLTSSAGRDSITEGYDAFKFVSGDARLRGGEIRIDIHPHPLDWIHFENTFSFVEAYQFNQPDSTRYLPFIPPPKWQSSFRIDLKKTGKLLKNTYAQIESELFFAQDRYFSAYGTETATPGYDLLNLGFGTDFMRKDKPVCSLYVSVNNIADVSYQSHLSRLKYTSENYATGRSGIYNMGRNFSFKLLIPVDLR